MTDLPNNLPLTESSFQESSPEELYQAGLDQLKTATDSQAKAEALSLIKKAADAGHSRSCLLYAFEITDARNIKVNGEEAFSYLQKAYSKDPNFPYNPIYRYFYEGIGTDKDIGKAIEIMKHQAELGNDSVLTPLGLIFLKRSDGFYDPLMAEIYLTRAANNGNATACYHLGRLLLSQKKTEEAFQRINAAADLGNAKALVFIADCHLAGDQLKQNTKTAIEYYERAAALGSADAMFKIGVTYKDGAPGIKANAEKAQYWLGEAYNNGYNDAKYLMGHSGIFAIGKKMKPGKLRNSLLLALQNLESTFFDIRESHLLKSKCHLSHFTAWPTLESIIPISSNDSIIPSKNRLRQYHVDYMNDPREGFRLLDFHKVHGNSAGRAAKAAQASQMLDEIFDEEYYAKQRDSDVNEVPPSVFICSLTAESDRLDLWRAYGNDGNGYCLTFEFNGQLQSTKTRIIRDRKNHYSHFDGFNVDDIENGDKIPPILYAIKYDNSDIIRTLTMLSAPLARIDSIIKTISSAPLKSEIKKCVAEILLELLFLYKDDQYENEREVRAISVHSILDSRVKSDVRVPGRLYVETNPFLFETETKITIGPKVSPKDTNPAIWNLRWRLGKYKYPGKTTIEKSKVQYR